MSASAPGEPWTTPNTTDIRTRSENPNHMGQRNHTEWDLITQTKCTAGLFLQNSTSGAQTEGLETSGPHHGHLGDPETR